MRSGRLTKILKAPELKKLAEAMVSFGKRVKKENFDRNGKNVQDSEALVLIGLRKAQPWG